MGRKWLKRRTAVLDPGFVAKDVNHVLMSGQSLSVGVNGTPVLTETQPYSNVMFSQGVMCGSASLASFVPLIEGDQPGGTADDVESGWAAMASLVTKMATEDLGAAGHVMLASAHGISGDPYVSLKKGTAPFTAGMAQVTAGKAVALGLGQTYVVRGVCIVHGETDCANDNQGYAAQLAEWQLDYDTDVKAITGQTSDVVMFHTQMSSWQVEFGNTSTMPIQQLAASVASGGKIVMVGPKYMLPYTDLVHLTNVGYRWMGEYYAKAYRRVVLEGLPWEPVRPLSVVRTGAVIVARFAVPVRPLVLDVDRVTNPGNYGFEYTDDGTPPAITDVRLISDNEVQVTLGSTPAGANQRLRYAYTGAGWVQSGPVTGPRGCLRDSDATESRHGNDLFNWCVTFDEPVTT